MRPQLQPPTGRHLGPASSVPHLRAGRGSMKSQGGYKLLKPGRSWQEEAWSRHTAAEEPLPSGREGGQGWMRRPRPRPHLHYFRTQGTSGGVLRAKKIRGHEWGRPQFEIKKSRLPPCSEPPAERGAGVERQQRLGGSQFSQGFRGRAVGESPP